MSGKLNLTTPLAYKMTPFALLRDGIAGPDGTDPTTGTNLIPLSRSINATDNRLWLACKRTGGAPTDTISITLLAKANDGGSVQDWIQLFDPLEIDALKFVDIPGVPGFDVWAKVTAVSGGTWAIHASFAWNTNDPMTFIQAP